jgi:hypothetical protein
LKEVAMHKSSVVLAALLLVHLIFPISVVRAQIAPDAIEIATGDVWPSRKNPVYAPQEILMPNIADDQAPGRTNR